MIACELAHLFIVEKHCEQTVILREKNGTRVLPIVIGTSEAMAISREIQGASSPRPLTHDLLFTTIGALGGKVEQMVINDLIAFNDGCAAYLAYLQIRTVQAQIVIIDCRPSDALAVAVRADCPLFVQEKVMEIAGVESAK